MYIWIIIAYPIAWMLDKCLGKEPKKRFTNRDFKTLIQLHSRGSISALKEYASKEEYGLTKQQSKLMVLALDLQEISVKKAMIPYSKVK
jgi:CBS domain containing-hemolysin-like protein